MSAHLLNRVAVVSAIVAVEICTGRAATGPIRESRTAKLIVDSFEGAPTRYHHRIRGKAAPVLTARSGYSRHGTGSLLIETGWRTVADRLASGRTHG